MPGCVLALLVSISPGIARAEDPQTALRALHAALERRAGHVEDSDGYRRELAQVEQRIAPLTNGDGRIERALYPLGGPDVGNAFSAFERGDKGLQELLIVDALPFGTPGEVAPLLDSGLHRLAYFGDKVGEGNWSFMSPLMELGLAGPAMLWEIEALGGRDVQVRYLDAEGAPRSPPTQPRRGFEGGPRKLPFYNAAERDIVEVSFEHRGKRRRVLYVQQHLESPETFAPLLKKQLARRWDAVIDKASLDGVPHDFYRRSIPHLVEGAVWLRDDQANGGERKRLPGALPEKTFRITHTEVPFGYGRAEIVQHGKNAGRRARSRREWERARRRRE